MSTISIDFDGVLHSYEDGWADGSIYGRLVPGAATALRTLLDTPYAVVVQTCRTPLFNVAQWLTGNTGIPTITDDGTVTFWTRTDAILVTDRKMPSVIYVDDRGYRFHDWEQTLTDLAALLPHRREARRTP